MKIKVNNINIDYEVYGTGNSIILLHGNGGSKKDFKKLISKLSDKYMIYAIDSRGHGKSEKTKEISYDLMAEDIYQFIVQLNINKPILIGFSDGGIVGLIIAIKYRDILSKLITCGANTIPDGISPKFIKVIKIINKILRSKKIYMMLKEPNISNQELNNINIPTFILAGEKDLILKEHTLYIANNIQGAKYKILKGETHFSYVLSGRVYNEIKEFINFNIE